MAAWAATNDGYKDGDWVEGKEREDGREEELEAGSGVTFAVREIWYHIWVEYVKGESDHCCEDWGGVRSELMGRRALGGI